jgi:hypothetical protein
VTQALAEPLREADAGSTDFKSDDGDGDPRSDVVWGHSLNTIPLTQRIAQSRMLEV